MSSAFRICSPTRYKYVAFGRVMCVGEAAVVFQAWIPKAPTPSNATTPSEAAAYTYDALHRLTGFSMKTSHPRSRSKNLNERSWIVCVKESPARRKRLGKGPDVFESADPSRLSNMA